MTGQTGHPLAAVNWSPRAVSLRRILGIKIGQWTLIDIDDKPKISSFSWYFQENRRDRFGFYGPELISPFVTSQQLIKENYSHKWLNWATKTKNQILSYTLTLPIMLVEFWNMTILCHTRHINAHSSNMKWPRCTKVKTWVIENIPLPFR